MANDFDRAKELFKLNERVFTVMGVWPLQSTYVKFTVWIVYFLLHMCMEFADFFYVFGDMGEMIFNLTESMWDIMIMVKLIVMRFSQTLVKLMTEIMDRLDSKFYDSPEEQEIYFKYDRIAKSFFKLWVSMAITAAIVYQIKPLEFRLKAVLQNESMPFVLPYRTRLFFDINDSSTFWLVWLYQCPMMCISVFFTATIGYIFCLVLHVCAQLSILTFRITNLDLGAHDNHESSQIIFRDIVTRHRSILGWAENYGLSITWSILKYSYPFMFFSITRMAKKINEVFGLVLLEELFICTLLLGLTSYSVLVNAEFQETAMFVSFLIYGSTLLLLIYGYCVAGDCLINESTKLYGAYYQCEWYDLSNSFKKQLIICMIGASKPIQLNGAGFCIFSLVSFTGVLKTAGGYISMLRTVV